MGHASASTTYDIYAHVIPELETESAKKTEARLLGKQIKGNQRKKKALVSKTRDFLCLKIGDPPRGRTGNLLEIATSGIMSPPGRDQAGGCELRR